MAGTFQYSYNPMRAMIVILFLAAVPSASSSSFFDDQDPETNPALVAVNIISEIRGVQNAVEINGRLVPNYSPTIVQAFSFPGIALDNDHVMAFFGYDRWIDVKSSDLRIEISTREGQKQKGELIGVDRRNGVAVARLLDGKLRKTPVCSQCDIKDGTTIMAPVMEGSNLSQYRKAQILSVGAWPGIPKQSGWMMAMNQAFPSINLPILTTDHRVLGLIASQDPMGRQTLVYPISELLSSAREILKKKRDIPAGWLGVLLEDSHPLTNFGIRIRGVDPDSPAQKAGLLSGDLVVKYRGQQIRDYRQFVYLVEGTPIGAKAKLEIIRQGNPMTVQASIEASKPPQNQILLSFNFPGIIGPPAPGGFSGRSFSDLGVSSLDFSGSQSSRTPIGIQAELLTPPLADAINMPGQTGLLVINVAKQRPADLAGVRPGDVITSIDGKSIRDPLGFASYLMTRDWSVPLVLNILRKGTELTIRVQIPDEDN